jgi:hypothetical protein
MSGDGSKLYMISDTGGSMLVYVSTDYGANFSALTAPEAGTRVGVSVSCDYAGTKVVCSYTISSVAKFGYSDDGGSTWSNLSNSSFGTETAYITPDGTTIFCDSSATGSIRKYVPGVKFVVGDTICTNADFAYGASLGDTLDNIVTAFNAKGGNTTAAHVGNTIEFTATTTGDDGNLYVTEEAFDADSRYSFGWSSLSGGANVKSHIYADGYTSLGSVVTPTNSFGGAGDVVIGSGLEVKGSLLAGSGVTGSIASTGDLTLSSTTSEEKGKIIFGISAYNESTNRLGVGTSEPASTLDVAGDLTVSTGATIGRDLLVEGSATLSGYTASRLITTGTGGLLTASAQTFVDHNSISNLATGDVHTQYALLAGRSGGQTITGGTAASNPLKFKTTSNATKGKLIFGNAETSVYDDVNARWGFGTATPGVTVDVAGQVRATSLDLTTPANITVSGGAGWRDIIGSPTIKATGSNDPTWSTFRSGIYAYEFSASAAKELWFTYHVDHDYYPGSGIFFHTHWSTTGTNTGVCRWGFEYTIAKGHQQSVFPTTTTVYVEQAATGTAYTHMVAEAASVSSSEIEVDALILVRVFRDAANGSDTLTDTAFLLTADIHYQANTFFTKNKAPNFYT